MQLSSLARTPSIAITTRQTIQKIITFLWVGVRISAFSLSSFISLLSVLHPQHKLAYFKNQGWEESWVDAAYNIVHEEYNCLYHLYALVHLNNGSDGDDNYIAMGSVDWVCVVSSLDFYGNLPDIDSLFHPHIAFLTTCLTSPWFHLMSAMGLSTIFPLTPKM